MVASTFLTPFKQIATFIFLHFLPTLFLNPILRFAAVKTPSFTGLLKSFLYPTNLTVPPGLAEIVPAKTLILEQNTSTKTNSKTNLFYP